MTVASRSTSDRKPVPTHGPPAARDDNQAIWFTLAGSTRQARLATVGSAGSYETSLASRTQRTSATAPQPRAPGTPERHTQAPGSLALAHPPTFAISSEH